MTGRDFKNIGQRMICVHGHGLTACATAHSNALVAQLAASAMSTLYSGMLDISDCVQVVSYKMLDIHCCSRTTSSCKGRLRLGSA